MRRSEQPYLGYRTTADCSKCNTTDVGTKTLEVRLTDAESKTTLFILCEKCAKGLEESCLKWKGFIRARGDSEG
jgi:DNA-directed RNA polymerase subunit M/transcription elongation factor TFIIS